MRHHAFFLSAGIAVFCAGCSSSSPGTRGFDDPSSGSGGGSSLTGGNGMLGSSGTPSLGNLMQGTGDSGSDCGTTLEVTFRDFTEKHPDFEMPFKGDVVRRKLLAASLGDDHKPVFKSSVGCPFKQGTPLDCDVWVPQGSVIQSADSFHQWYNTTDGVNIELKKTLDLVGDGNGQYGYDTTAFFPLSPTEGFGVSPKNGDNPGGKNFLFTTEIHLRFGYVAGQKFTFRGDDDLWIFVNGQLALDLGSLHAAEEGTIDFDAQAAALGISPGMTYSMDIFHAERHTSESNFKVTTNISCFEPVDIAK